MPKSTMGRATLQARFDGHCLECEKGIHRGTVCRMINGRLAHDVCPEDQPRPICQVCWLEMPCEHSDGSA